VRAVDFTRTKIEQMRNAGFRRGVEKHNNAGSLLQNAGRFEAKDRGGKGGERELVDGGRRDVARVHSGRRGRGPGEEEAARQGGRLAGLQACLSASPLPILL
jgi:hypothetical protein